jgi:hypothetical protein
MAYKRHEITADDLARIELDDPGRAAHIRAICLPDREEQKIRFGKSTWPTVGGRADYIAAAEYIIDQDHTGKVWDFLADKRKWPPGLGEFDARYLARKALARDKELGRIAPATVGALLILLCGPARLKIENENPDAHRRARAAIRENPTITIGQLCRDYNLPRATAQAIKQDVLGGIHQTKNR